MFKAIFDFRHPQNQPDGKTHQYTLEGMVNELDPDNVLFLCDGEHSYRLNCKKNSDGAFEGKCETATLRVAKLGEREYIGIWIEDGISILVMVEEK